MRDAETVQQDDAAPQPEPVDPVAQHRESMQGMNREQLLEQYADADMAHEGRHVCRSSPGSRQPAVE